jgi:hypothetical protein
MNKKDDPYEIAIDQILEGADGDIRLALRTVLIQNLELHARLLVFEKATTPPDHLKAFKDSMN